MRLFFVLLFAGTYRMPPKLARTRGSVSKHGEGAVVPRRANRKWAQAEMEAPSQHAQMR